MWMFRESFLVEREAFAKLMLGLGYSPLIFDVHFLCTCVNTVQANKVYVHLTGCALFSRAGLV